MKRMKIGDYFQYHCGNITYAVVKDKTLMKLLYNHIPGTWTTNRKLSNNQEKILPLALHHYVNYARGVDVVNQLHYQYIMGRKSKRCWPRLVWWLLELCILNAFYLWKKNTGGKSHKKFRLSLIREIRDKYNLNTVLSSTDPLVHNRNTSEHQIVYSVTQSNCYICWNEEGKRKCSNFKCLSCCKFVCVSPCYDIHRKA